MKGLFVTCLIGTLEYLLISTPSALVDNFKLLAILIIDIKYLLMKSFDEITLPSSLLRMRFEESVECNDVVFSHFLVRQHRTHTFINNKRFVRFEWRNAALSTYSR